VALAALELDFEFDASPDDDPGDANGRELPFPAMQRLTPPRLRYLAWVEEQIEDFKCSVRREELLELADEAVTNLIDAPDGQYQLTEILVCDAVDRLIFQRLDLPSFKKWQRMYQNDTDARPNTGTDTPGGVHLDPS
jgi:hypothetical protein